MLILAVAAHIVMLIVLFLIVRDAYENEGGLIALIAFVIPFYALYYLFFKMGTSKKTAITLWLFALFLYFVPLFPPVSKALHRDDACSLVTKEDINRELGMVAGDPESTPSGGGCRYPLQTDPPNALVVRIGPCDADTIATITRRSGAFPVSEVGDEAASIGRELWVRRASDCYVAFLQGGSSSDDTLQGRKRLIGKVIERRGK